MSTSEFLDAAEKYAEMGWAVQEQFRAVVDGEPLEDQNPNALTEIAQFLRWFADLDDRGLADKLEAHVEAHGAVES